MQESSRLHTPTTKKHRQRRNKDCKIVIADEGNFNDFVSRHTCMMSPLAAAHATQHLASPIEPLISPSTPRNALNSNPDLIDGSRYQDTINTPSPLLVAHKKQRQRRKKDCKIVIADEGNFNDFVSLHTCMISPLAAAHASQHLASPIEPLISPSTPRNAWNSNPDLTSGSPYQDTINKPSPLASPIEHLISPSTPRNALNSCKIVITDEGNFNDFVSLHTSMMSPLTAAHATQHLASPIEPLSSPSTPRNALNSNPDLTYGSPYQDTINKPSPLLADDKKRRQCRKKDCKVVIADEGNFNDFASLHTCMMSPLAAAHATQHLASSIEPFISPSTLRNALNSNPDLTYGSPYQDTINKPSPLLAADISTNDSARLQSLEEFLHLMPLDSDDTLNNLVVYNKILSSFRQDFS
ncbi:hypothetical protein KP509_23G050700 [Ceratopteris richardii]|uniref:Uncharacterized protein n=1 Tax=Ceratopteris richardii TaxID=49495 RepID=A0A8T2S1I9_CERRI|nr:hypothetical protein KP509_23G050700 [Ceratopteris richardii]